VTWLQNLALNKAKSKKTLNIKVVGNFINSLKRVKTQNFDIGRRNHEAVKLVGFSIYDFELESIFLKFLLVFKLRFLMQYECMMPCTCWPYMFLTKRKCLPNIDVVRIVSNKSHSTPWLALTKQSYAIVVSVPVEKHNIYIYIIIHLHLSPNWHPDV
jgi:hypothetical protein